MSTYKKRAAEQAAQTYGSMEDLWRYLKDVLKLNTKYQNGSYGQCENGIYLYDCVCLIKSYPWCDGTAGKTPQYRLNNVPDDWIGALYEKAATKGTMEKLPEKGILAVYLNSEHIGIYNAATKTVIECCAGAANKVVERDRSFYDGTQYAWNKWSDIYWCPQKKAKRSFFKRLARMLLRNECYFGITYFGITN